MVVWVAGVHGHDLHWLHEYTVFTHLCTHRFVELVCIDCRYVLSDAYLLLPAHAAVDLLTAVTIATAALPPMARFGLWYCVSVICLTLSPNSMWGLVGPVVCVVFLTK